MGIFEGLGNFSPSPMNDNNFNMLYGSNGLSKILEAFFTVKGQSANFYKNPGCHKYRSFVSEDKTGFDFGNKRVGD